MEKNFVVLGANGFVGSHIVDRLASVPESQIYCFDRFLRPQSFRPAPNVHAISGDFFKDEDTEKALRHGGYLIHCFSSTTPRTSDDNPQADIDLLKRNVRIFEDAISLGAEKIVYISSGGAVYGRSGEEADATEEVVALPVSPYGIAKLASEHYLEYFNKKHGTPYIVHRLTNPYGPRQLFKNGQGIIPAFLEKINNGEAITVFGDGESTRDYIYIEDAVEMISRSLLENNRYSTYNIGSGSQTSQNEIIKLLSKYVRSDIEVNYEDTPDTFLRRTNISIDRYENEFGKPKITSFEDGLVRTIKYLKT
jgi:UDP-glucose 4-epimerase